MPEPDPLALADRLFGPEPEKVPGQWFYGNNGTWHWAPDPEDDG